MPGRAECAAGHQRDAGVALVPGSAFGTPGHARFSFACGIETLKQAVERIGQALKSSD